MRMRRRRRLRDHLAMPGDARDRACPRGASPARYGASGRAGRSRAHRYRGRSTCRSRECRAACRAATSASAIFQAMSIAPFIDGASTGQRSIGTITCARKAEKPTSTISFVPWRACSTARLRPSPCASIRSSTSVVDAGGFERRCDEIALPGAIGRLRPMLGRAAAANSEMRAERLDAVGRRLDHAQQMPAVRMARDAVGVDRLARATYRARRPARRDMSAMPSPRCPISVM